MYKLGVDIGGTKINFGVLSNENVLLAHKKISVLTLGSKYFFENIAKEIKVFLGESNYVLRDFEFCGVGVPGTVDKSGRIAVNLPNLGLYNVSAADSMERILHMPVKLVQDSRAAAWAEYCVGNGRGYQNVICLTLGTGIGLGIVANGEIFHGTLGTAGEIGHNCVVQNGRNCNCGKKGCLGMYSAGLGLEKTACEVIHPGATSEELFCEAENGNELAKRKINEAMCYLGNEIVSLFNNLAPDCILFSGGISNQKKLYVTPLIKYIQEHIYTVEGGAMPNITIAALGENAPMIGAALLPWEHARANRYSASIMCADIMHLDRDFDQLKEAGINLFHMDIMDGHFVPNLMIPMEYINRMRKNTDAVFDVHIMAEHPERIVDSLQLKQGDIVCVHYESTIHLQGVLTKIKEKKLKAGVAINPATPFDSIIEILDDIDMVLIMTVNPGHAGQKMIEHSIQKISQTRAYLDKHGYQRIEIEVDGNCSFDNIPKMQKAGANIFVLGTSGLFRSDISMRQAIDRIESSINQ